MLSGKFREAIDTIVERLNKDHFDWMLVGSVNMALQGIDVTPRDLDFVVRFEDLERIRNVFSDYGVSEVSELKPFIDRAAWDVHFEIEGIDVQFLGEKDDGEYVRWMLKKCVVFVDRIRCFDLRTEAGVYARTNRKNRADEILNFLDNV